MNISSLPIILLDGDWAIVIVKDWFGENAKISHKDEKIYVDVRCNEIALYYWIMQYSDYVKMISPVSLVNKVKEGLINALKRYE